MEGLQLDEDVHLVIDLELRLLQLHVRLSAGELDRLLHPDFFEFGASGRKWDRSQMITSLTGGEVSGEDVPVTASEITGTRLADDVVLVTYVSQRNQRRARRSSVWRRTAAGWRLYFHQGTLTEPAQAT